MGFMDTGSGDWSSLPGVAQYQKQEDEDTQLGLDAQKQAQAAQQWQAQFAANLQNAANENAYRRASLEQALGIHNDQLGLQREQMANQQANEQANLGLRQQGLQQQELENQRQLDTRQQMAGDARDARIQTANIQAQQRADAAKQAAQDRQDAITEKIYLPRLKDIDEKIRDAASPAMVDQLKSQRQALQEEYASKLRNGGQSAASTSPATASAPAAATLAPSPAVRAAPASVQAPGPDADEDTKARYAEWLKLRAQNGINDQQAQPAAASTQPTVAQSTPAKPLSDADQKYNDLLDAMADNPNASFKPSVINDFNSRQANATYTAKEQQDIAEQKARAAADTLSHLESNPNADPDILRAAERMADRAQKALTLATERAEIERKAHMQQDAGPYSNALSSITSKLKTAQALANESRIPQATVDLLQQQRDAIDTARSNGVRFDEWKKSQNLDALQPALDAVNTAQQKKEQGMALQAIDKELATRRLNHNQQEQIVNSNAVLSPDAKSAKIQDLPTPQYLKSIGLKYNDQSPEPDDGPGTIQDPVKRANMLELQLAKLKGDAEDFNSNPEVRNVLKQLATEKTVRDLMRHSSTQSSGVTNTGNLNVSGDLDASLNIGGTESQRNSSTDSSGQSILSKNPYERFQAVYKADRENLKASGVDVGVVTNRLQKEINTIRSSKAYRDAVSGAAPADSSVITAPPMARPGMTPEQTLVDVLRNEWGGVLGDKLAPMVVRGARVDGDAAAALTGAPKVP